jgi:phosphoribosylaminoimidazole-succinocarboxamide synthase
VTHEVTLKTDIPDLPVRRGKVRDVYDLGDSMAIVATDRISAFDVVMPTGIPNKGKVLTQLSTFWFKWLGHQVDHHLQKLVHKPTDLPKPLWPYADVLCGRTVIVRKAEVVPVECVVRGYLAGSGWKSYQADRSVCGITLPVGLRQCDALPEPIFTPTTKATSGHDENLTFEQAAALCPPGVMETLRRLSIQVYRAAAEYARGRGVIIADTKFEWGLVDGKYILIDEVLTPDSSRFWPADRYQPGRDQESFDKQYVRNYLETLSWNKTPPGPDLPSEVVANTTAKYVEAYERLTGRRFEG